jgi:prevent-host-death family protein
MQKTYSITEARNHFTDLVRKVEQSTKSVRVTRRGQPVAVILSVGEYERLLAQQPKRDFWTAYQQWRQKWNVDELDIDPDQIWEDVRDRTPAPDVNPWH